MAALALLGTGASQSQAELKDSEIVFGGDAEYPPFEWDDRGTARGFYVELAAAVAESGGVRHEHRLGQWPDAIRALESGAVDVVAMFESEERAQRFLFTPAFHYVNHGIFARDGADAVSSLRDLAGRTVAVEELSYAHERLRVDDLGTELSLTPNTVAALQAVAEHRADYAILAAPTARYLIRDRGMPLSEVGPPVWPAGYSFAVKNDRPVLADWLAKQLTEVLRSGTYGDIRSRWEPELGRQTGSGTPLILGPALLPALTLTLLGAAWLLMKRRAVEGLAAGPAAERGEATADPAVSWARDHDVYTELPRLHVFIERVDALLRRAGVADGGKKQVAAIRPADLERTIRTLGHDAAIASVRDIARRLREMGFAVCGQSGRDVYLVFSDKAEIDEKLRALASPFDTLVMSSDPGPQLFVGSAKWPDDGSEARELVRRAETALADAVHRRDAWVEYRSSMEPDAGDLRLLRSFRERAGNGLYPVFQPQVDIRTGRVVAAEALARWDVPETGIVSPQKFIPLLEEFGLIRHVTSRMIYESVRVAAELRRSGFPCPISVNVAMSDLLGDKTRRAIFKALRAHDALPTDLTLELTETSVADSAETVRWVMTRLRESGIRVSVDDFGTGYSSLSYLSDFPIHEIKIDQSFISGIADKRQNRSIVRSTITMAHELGLSVVAEGVDSEEAMAILREDGCDRAQGFLISRPLPEAEFVSFLQSADGRSVRTRKL